MALGDLWAASGDAAVGILRHFAAAVSYHGGRWYLASTA
jgi:hypothetical protein